MSASLGTIPYPTVDPTEDPANPLTKYQKQLDPLAKLTDQLWQTPRAAPNVAPIQPPTAAMSLSRLAQQAMTPSQTGAPQMGMPLPEVPSEASRAPPPALSMMPGGSASLRALAAQGAPAAPSLGGSEALAGTSGGLLAEGGPTDVTQYRQDPGTGAITRRPVGAAARMLRSLAPDVPEYQPGQPTAAEPPAEAPRSRSEERISTRVPSEAAQKAQGIDTHSRSDLSIGLPSMKEGKEAWDKNAAMIKANYPGFQKLRTDNPNRIKETFIQHAVDNLKFLHAKMTEEHGEEVTQRAGKWYEGANKIAHDLAQEFNVHPRQAAAVLAALSPQKDWYQNVDLARRLMEINQRHGGNLVFTPEMRTYAGKYIDQLRKDDKDPNTIAELERLKTKFENTPPSALKTPFEQAVWSRWFDEAHNSRDYKLVTPEGETGATVMVPARIGKRGNVLEEAKPRKVSWGSFKEISKAMEALKTSDLPTISRLMGGNHKVRNFFNNIIAPLHGHDVTIDTHAIAAALLRPLGAKALEVGHGLGTTVGKGRVGAANNATIGNKGLYGLYAEAYRRAAKDLGISPRELQSITWEGVRGLFSPEDKRNEAFVKHNESIWRGDGQYAKMTNDQKRQAVYDHAGGIKAPSWAGGEEYGDDEE